MRFPSYLQHKPIIGVDDYDKVDGIYANNSDAKALSIGYAQYNRNEISAKIWRHTGEKWSRQSEELPLHRVIDLAALIVSLYYDDPTKNHAPHLEPRIQPCEEYHYVDYMEELREYLAKNDEVLKPKLRALKDLLNGLNI
ncbi:MAG: hypothetical protein IJT73_00465 [Selenomonadaceae bacterium]|nr:hypothetical protein [Selenomonadaceae bacterium]